MDCKTVMSRLQDAQQAYHLLLTGRSPRVIVDQNGERLEYSVANRADLLAYIQLLQQEANACGLLTSRPPRRYALGLKLG